MSTLHCIGISGINATDNPGPGVAVARSLREQFPDARLIGLSYELHDPGNYMPELFSNSFLMPYPTRGWHEMQGALDKVRAMTGMDALIPCLDAELPLLIRHRDDLARKNIRTLLPTEGQFELRGKDRLAKLCEKLDCRYPRTELANGIDELCRLAQENFAFPMVVKGKFYKAYIVHNLQAAVLKGSEIAAEWGFPILLQEVVQGHEINLVGLGDGEGGLLGRVAIKKQLTTSLGKVWTAVTIHDDALDRLAIRFCKETGWRGPFELECMRGPDGLYLIEINPRFPAWVYFATGVGINLPAQVARLIAGEKNLAAAALLPAYPAGKYLVRQTSEFVTDLDYFQNLLTKQNREGL